MRQLRPILIAYYAATFLALSALSQSKPEATFISGIVVDVRGAGITGAHVSLVPKSGSTPVAATSDTNGHFSFAGLQSGPYDLTISATGFQTMTKSVLATKDVVPDAMYLLQIASVQTNVDVVVTATRSAQRIEDVPASVSVVTREQLDDTPARTIDDVLRRVPSVDLPLASTNEQHPTDTIRAASDRYHYLHEGAKWDSFARAAGRSSAQ